LREVRRAELVAVIGKPCAYCGDPMAAPTRDHIRPRSKGGRFNQPGNKAFACMPCNKAKGSRTLRQWLRRLEMAGDPRAVFVRAISETPGTDPSESATGSGWHRMPEGGGANRELI
jgi:hypothetical protein